MNKLRQELQKLLAGTPYTRTPALRRSLREDFLYASDLPQAADRDAVESFLRKAREAGWHASETEGWIQLDKVPQDPPEFPGIPGPEAKCCASLLRRHPGPRRTSERERRMLYKAAEESAGARETVCGKLHREWAADLRTHRPLPDVETYWFEKEEREDADQADRAR